MQLKQQEENVEAESPVPSDQAAKVQKSKEEDVNQTKWSKVKEKLIVPIGRFGQNGVLVMSNQAWTHV